MRSMVLAFLAAALAGGFTSVIGAQKAKPKPPTKPKPPALGALGTDQMPGEVCKFGQAYTLGRRTGSAINVNVVSAEYLATRIKTGKTFVFPKADTKLIVVRYTLHNPLPKEQRFGQTLKVTAVMPDMKNFETIRTYAQAEPNIEVEQVLKPAQKIAGYCVIEVPAVGVVDKLIVANRSEPGSMVARYPMAGNAAKIRPPYVDPSDATGTTPLKVMKVGMGQAYEIGAQDVAVLNVEQVSERINELDGPDPGKVFVMVTFQVTCRNEEGGWMSNFAGGWLYNRLLDADGGEYGTSNYCFRTSSNAPLDPRTAFGEPVSFRKPYLVAKGVKLDYVRLKELDSREIRFDLGGFSTK